MCFSVFFVFSDYNAHVLPADDVRREAFCTSHLGILRAKYEYQRVKRIFKARTSMDRRILGKIVRISIGISKECLRHIRIHGIDFVTKPPDGEIEIAIRMKLQE